MNELIPMILNMRQTQNMKHELIRIDVTFSYTLSDFTIFLVNYNDHNIQSIVTIVTCK